MDYNIIKELENKLQIIYSKKYIGIDLNNELLNIMISECEEIMYEMLLARNIDPLTSSEKMAFDLGSRTVLMTKKLQTAFKQLIESP